jgi:hypothetical protein
MAHRIYPILGGLALGLTVFALQPAAAAMNGNAAEYSDVGADGLAPREASAPPGLNGPSLRVAQTGSGSGDSAGTSARENLRQELDRIRRESATGASTPSFDPPLPVRRKTGQTEAAANGVSSALPVQHPAHAADPQADRATGKLLLLSFRGSQPADAGPKAIRALLQSGLIAGAVFGRENIQSRAQLKELMKFIWPGGVSHRPLFAIREIGSSSDALPPIKDFERWPSEMDIVSKGDPQYAYSTYRSLGANLASLGFNMNFGPVLAVSGDGLDPASSFGGDPLQAGVFAKTFILGHREENVIAVPIVDGSEHTVRALKTIAISNPGIPIGSVIGKDRAAPPFSAYDGFISGVRICLAGHDSANLSASAFKRGCDVLVLNGAGEAPSAVRDEVALAISQAVRDGELTYEALNAAAQRVSELRGLELGRSQ